MRPKDVYAIHGDAFVTRGDVFETHGATFVNRDATVYSHFPDSNLRYECTHYDNGSLKRTNVDQTVCGYKCRFFFVIKGDVFLTHGDVFVSYGGVFVTHSDVLVTHGYFCATHGSVFGDLQR